jgi:hypothetical protein
MANNIIGNTPRIRDKNPRSAGAVRVIRWGWPNPDAPLVRLKKPIRLMATLVKKRVDVQPDNLDQEIYDGTPVTRTLRPTRTSGY